MLVQLHTTTYRFAFVCNDYQCQIAHYNRYNKVLERKNFDINNIQGFEYRLERRKTKFYESRREKLRNAEVYYIYIKHNDGSSSKLSPLFIGKQNLYFAQDMINELNNGLKNKNINYNFR